MAMHMCWPRASQPAQPFPSCHRCWSRAAHTAARRSYGGACAMPSTPSECAVMSPDGEETQGSRTCRQSGPPPAARIRSTFCLASRATSRATGTIGRSGSSTAAAPRPSTRAGPTIRGSSCRSAGEWGSNPNPRPRPKPRARARARARAGARALRASCCFPGREQLRRQPHVSSPQPRVP